MKVIVEGDAKEIAELLATIRHDNKNKEYFFGKFNVADTDKLKKNLPLVVSSCTKSDADNLIREYNVS